MAFPATRTLAVVLFAAALFVSGCWRSAPVHQRHEAKAEGNRKAAPPFTLKDAEGKTVSLEDYKGKVVLLNFWATWCGPCKIEIPWFVAFEQKYKDQGFSVVGISMDEDGWNIVKPFLADEKINYRVLLGNDSVGTLYGGVDSLPTTFVIDREGNIAATHIGLVSKTDYEDEIVQVLEAKRTAAGADARAAARSN